MPIKNGQKLILQREVSDMSERLQLTRQSTFYRNCCRSSEFYSYEIVTEAIHLILEQSAGILSRQNINIYRTK